MILYLLKNTFKALLILLLFSECSNNKYDNEKIKLKTEKKIVELNELINDLSKEQKNSLFDLYYNLGVEVNATKKSTDLTNQEKQNKIKRLTAQSGKDMHEILTEEQFEKYREYQKERKSILYEQIKEKVKEMKFNKTLKSDSTNK